MPLRGGTSAAKRAMRASGSRSTDAVPSDHGFLSSSLTMSSSSIFSRSLASGGRRMYQPVPELNLMDVPSLPHGMPSSGAQPSPTKENTPRLSAQTSNAPLP